ncbi:MAG TPA: hypoxanthine phosphoribosyltransferase [Blastocatellia bacterium]|jgi:hypoxanthine phosphoribosyltransferase|nr:hypoxanthine phosphoribosyltransferase [Blastocatellia bacterium]
MKNLLTDETGLGKVLIAQDRLQERVSELGLEISGDYGGKDVVLVAILKGSFIFAADLLRAMTTTASVDFMAISSYAGQTGSGVVRITKDLDESIQGRHVLLVEDIIDTGLTGNYLLQTLRRRDPASIRVCALLDKSVRRIIDLPIAYRGFDIPDVFVVGYGMDYQQRYRNLPHIAVLRPNSRQ